MGILGCLFRLFQVVDAQPDLVIPGERERELEGMRGKEEVEGTWGRAHGGRLRERRRRKRRRRRKDVESQRNRVRKQAC